MLIRRLDELSTWLGAKPYLEGTFTAGDLIMTTVLRELDDPVCWSCFRQSRH